MIEYLLSAAMAIGPALGYIDQVSLGIAGQQLLLLISKAFLQYFIIKRQQSSSGFNPVTCAILLFSK